MVLARSYELQIRVCQDPEGSAETKFLLILDMRVPLSRILLPTADLVNLRVSIRDSQTGLFEVD